MVLTPFKLLPFFPVRVRFGVVFVDCNLVEVLTRVRVIREHVYRNHFPVNRGKGQSGMTEGDFFFRPAGDVVRTDQPMFPF